MGVKLAFWRREEREEKTLGADDVLRALLEQASSKSGVPVNWRTAQQASTAMACARLIAEGLSQIPLKLFRDLPGGGREPASDANVYELLYRQPNAMQTAFEFLEQRALHLAFCGNAFALIVRVNGRIVELLPYEPQHVTIKRDGWHVSYEVDAPDGRKLPVSAVDMWHTRGPSWTFGDGLEGVRLAREAIGLSLALEDHGSRLFKNGAQPGGLLSTDATPTAEQRQALRESWEAAYGGANKFKTAVLWGGWRWMALASPNDSAQFLESRAFQVEEVCRAFRVLPIMVGHSDKAATFASAEQMFLAHQVHTMGPWYRRLEQSADLALLTPKERAQGLHFRFVVNAMMRGAVKDRADYYSKLYGIGALNPNEIRALEEMNPYDGGEQYRVPLNMTDPAAEPESPQGDANAAP